MQGYSLIADSGSTKTNWCLLPSETGAQEVFYFSTIGLNPNVLDMATVLGVIQNEVSPWVSQMLGTAPPRQVLFYGAGCSDISNAEAVAAPLRTAFPASAVAVEHDLLGAAHSVAQGQPAVVCILGTGSSACVYDGQNITHTRGANGYLFADWGAGVDIGRRLLDAMLEGDMPPVLTTHFIQAFGEPPIAFRHRVYQAAERPNFVVAQLASFAQMYSDIPEVEALVSSCFGEFVRRVAAPLSRGPQYPFRAVGSVAAAFQAPLARAFATHGLVLASVAADPLPGLLAYHRSMGIGGA